MDKGRKAEKGLRGLVSLFRRDGRLPRLNALSRHEALHKAKPVFPAITHISPIDCALLSFLSFLDN